jgi:hypothetical protein
VGFIPVEAVSPENKADFKSVQDSLDKDFGITHEESGKAQRIYTKWIMLEHSDVPVPSNAQSLNIAVGKGELEISTNKFKKEMEIEIIDDEVIEIEDDEEPETKEVDTEKAETDVDADNDIEETEAVEEKEIEKKEEAETPNEIKEEEVKEEIDPMIDYAEQNKSILLLVKSLTEDVAELKEGRVLSKKNRKLISDVVELADKLSVNLKDLLIQTDPNPADDSEKTIEIFDDKIDEKQVIEITEAIGGDVKNPTIKEMVANHLSQLSGKIEEE